MEKLEWIKELVKTEQEMEESGIVDTSTGFDPEQLLASESIDFLHDLKTSFVEAASTFNQLKATQIGRVKIYGISNTHADFMLFRNSFKLIFALKEPGVIGIRFQFAGTEYHQYKDQENPNNSEEDFLNARWGPFGDLIWTYQEQAIKIDFLIKYYLSRFIRISTR